MIKKLKKKGISLLILLLFISNQGLNFAHIHFESEDKKSCQHSGNDTHIHNKQTEKCAICQHNFHSSLFYFIPKTIAFFQKEGNNNYSKYQVGEFDTKLTILLRGPPVLIL